MYFAECSTVLITCGLLDLVDPQLYCRLLDLVDPQLYSGFDHSQQ